MLKRLLALALLATHPSLSWADSIEFSSQRVTGEGNGAAALAFDGDLGTAWIEGVPGMGRGEWVEVTFTKPKDIQTLTLFNGNFESTTTHLDYAHIEKAVISWEGEKGGQIDIFPSRDYEPLTVAIGDQVRKIRLTLDASYDGNRFSETQVAEIAFNWGQVDGKKWESLQKWTTKSGKKQMAAYDQTLQGALEAAKGGSLDDAQRQTLETAITRGHPVHRKWVESRVAPGFWMNYLPGDLAAIDALGQVKSVKSTAKIEQAAWRLADVNQREPVVYLGKWLRAYEALQANNSSGVAYWGNHGTLKGMLNGRNEALDLVVDEMGQIFIVDMANNRVQRFNENGKSTAMTGENRGISSEFLGNQVDPYVVGHLPSESPGQMVNPLALSLLQRGKDDVLAVIDSNLRIHLLDKDLKPLGQWKVESDYQYMAGYGLQNPLLVQAKNGQVTAFVGNEGIVFDLDGHELRRFTLDIAPTSGVFYRRRYLLTADNGQILAYTGDGYRDRVFFEIPEGDRSQNLDITVDDGGKIIAHSEGGFAYQLDKKGRLLQVQKTLDEAEGPVRIAAQGGLLFLSHNDGIQRRELLAF